MKRIFYTSSFLPLFLLPSITTRRQEKLNREILPIVLPEPAFYSELDGRNTTPPARFEVTGVTAIMALFWFRAVGWRMVPSREQMKTRIHL